MSKKSSPLRLLPLRKRARREPSPETHLPTPPPEPPRAVCGVCFDDLQDDGIDDAGDRSEGRSLRCSHKFCVDCWRSYLSSKIRDEAQCSIRCMEAKCPTAVEESFLRELLMEDEVTLSRCVNHITIERQLISVSRYDILLSESFVGATPSLRFCPFPSCNVILSCPGIPRGSSLLLTSVPTVTCCGSSRGASSSKEEHVSCFGCGLEGGHAPVICAITKLWLGAAREDSGTAQWIKANTRTCPKCSNNIEKAGGCKCVLELLCPLRTELMNLHYQSHGLSPLQIPILLDVYEGLGRSRLQRFRL